MFSQSAYQVRFEWGESGMESCADGVDLVIVVDVLSFCTAVDIAVGRGAAVLPYPWNDEAAGQYAAEQNAVLASRTTKLGGFSLSPSSLQSIPAGTRLVLPSPNGASLSFRANALGKVVVAGCLRNAAAIGSWASSECAILVVAAGEKWSGSGLRPCFEDLIGAGAVIDSLDLSCSPEARSAQSAYLGARVSLRDSLFGCGSGRELVERGRSSDIELAARLNASNVVPLLSDGSFRNAASIGSTMP